MSRKKTIYIEDKLIGICEKVLEKSNPTLLRRFKKDKWGWKTRVVIYILEKFLDAFEERENPKL